MGSQAERTCRKAADRLGDPTFVCRQTGRNNNWGARKTTQPRVPAQGNKASKPLIENICGGCGGGRNSQPHRRVHWRDSWGTQTHPPGNQHQESPICLWLVEEVTESWSKAQQVALFPFGPLSHIQYHNTATWVALPWRIPKALPLTM